jgi:DNA-binding transcriptional ArsR family regulator
VTSDEGHESAALARKVAPEPVELGASAIQALSHPLRVQLAWQLARLNTARTSDLAAAIGEAPNKTSYHLRILSDHGIITRVTPPARPDSQADGRETWWRLTSPGGIGWNRRDPAVAAVAGDLEAAIDRARDARAAAARVNADGDLPQMSVLMPAALTRAEATHFHDRLREVADEIFEGRRQRTTDPDVEVEYDVEISFLPVWKAD